jgi:LuxR family quorum-sensing system transcriptional regulator CciR
MIRVADFLEKTNAASTPEEVFNHFRSAVAAFGYDRICFAAMSPAAQQAFPQRTLQEALALKVPEDWTRHYVEHEYIKIDPVALVAPTQRKPYEWSDVLRLGDFSTRQRTVLHECREAGMHNGLSIPLYGPAGEAFLVSLATDNVPVDNRHLHSQLHILAMQFHVAYASLAGSNSGITPPVRLSNREHECLSWTARGKSAWTISKIIGVSENTVNFHLKSAMKKLGTTNRVQSVAIAIRAGLIQP